MYNKQKTIVVFFVGFAVKELLKVLLPKGGEDLSNCL